MPPLKYPQSIQIGRLIKFLDKKPNVIYAKDKNIEENLFNDFDKYICKKIQIEYKSPNKYISFLLRKFLSFFYLTPDIYKNWSKKLYFKADNFLNKNQDISQIVTFGQPHSVHLAGLKLKQKNKNLNWIAHFSDPWVDNYLDKKDFISEFINKKLEKNVFETADKLIFTSEETIEQILKRYSYLKDKIYYLPHSFDSNLYNFNLKRDENKFILRYIGGFYAQRSPEPLFKAIENIQKNSSNLLKNVIFEIVGNLGRHQVLLKKYKNIEKYLKFTSSVDYKTSLDLMVTSDILLVIDAPAQEKSLFFPSKLVDYIGSKRPIVGVTPNGTSKNIINSFELPIKTKTADPKNIDEVVNLLTQVLKNKNKLKNFEVDSDAYKKYKVENISEEFLRIVKYV
jgi:glycosyltransferase involved in cell wall biosynthesis